LLRRTILNIAKRNRGGGVYASFLIYDNKKNGEFEGFSPRSSSIAD